MQWVMEEFKTNEDFFGRHPLESTNALLLVTMIHDVMLYYTSHEPNYMVNARMVPLQCQEPGEE